MKDGKRCAAVVLAAGKGKRMQSDVAKQFLLLKGKPILYYSLKAFEDSYVDEVILVCSAADIAYCRKEIVEKYDFHKIRAIVPGGKERYHSVAAGLRAVSDCDYVMIHDGARPFVDEAMLERLFIQLERYNSAIAAMPVKDTIKVADEEGFAVDTPNRSTLWQMQTPQCFAFEPIRNAYEELLLAESELMDKGIQITDDAMVMETFGKLPIKLAEGSYRNIKITTPEDLVIGEALLG